MRNRWVANLSSFFCSTLLVAGVSCSSGETTESTAFAEGGTIATASEATLATVVAVDSTARTVTLRRADGRERRYHCGRDVVNFGRIKVGDQVNATIVESVAVFVRKSNDPPFEGEASAVALAPRGDKPGVVMADTAEVSAKIIAVDKYAGTITIESPEEMTTLLVGPNVDLSRFKKGDVVTLRVSEALALLVEKPR